MSSRQLSLSAQHLPRSRSIVLLGVAAFYTSQSSAFSAPLAIRSHSTLTPAVFTATSNREVLLYMTEEDETQQQQYAEEYEYVEDEGAFVDPQPPSYSPRVDEQLEGDLYEAERRIMLYGKEINMMREQLVMKTEQLEDEQNIFRGEKSNLMTKIAEFTSMLSQRDDELVLRNSASSASKENERELQQEINSIKAQLEAKTSAYEDELQATTELKRRYEEANDAIEFEQMAFQKQKKELQETINGEKKNIKALENKLQETQSSFEKIREDLLNRIKAEQEKLFDTQGSWQKAKDALKQAQQNLQDSLKDKEETLQESKQELMSQRGKFDGERDELKQRIQAEQITVKKVLQDLKDEQSRFEKSKKALEAAISGEQKTVRRLQEEMIREKTRFDNERETLEFRIKEESERLSRVETELSEERDNYSKMKEQLEKNLSEEIRVGKLKKRQMNDRYNEIRNELTQLWEGSKRDARKDQARLQKKYEKQLDDVQKRVVRLEGDLNASNESSKELSLLLAEAEASKQRLVAESEAMEGRYKDTLKQQDVAIGELRENVVGLQTSIRQKDVIIKDQRKQIGKYETSFRAVARLSFTVTGNKIKGAGRRVKGLIRTKSPKDE